MDKHTQTNKQETKQINTKKFQIQDQLNFSLSSSVVTPSPSSPGVGIKAEALSYSCQVIGESCQFSFPVFQWQLLSQLLPQSGVAVCLYFVLRFQRTAL
jgi:hypothetical protein